MEKNPKVFLAKTPRTPRNSKRLNVFSSFGDLGVLGERNFLVPATPA
jgi:hypothetical protein